MEVKAAHVGGVEICLTSLLLLLVLVVQICLAGVTLRRVGVEVPWVDG